MAGLFNHFVNDPRRQQEQERMEQRIRERLSRRASDPSTVVPSPEVYDASAASRPRLVPNPVSSQDPYDVQMGNQRAITQSLSNPNDPNFRPVENNDKGIMGRIGDIFRQFVISAGQSYNTGAGDPTQRLLGALGGGVAGGAYAGFNPEIDEQRQRLYDINRSQQQEGVLEQQRQADLANRSRMSVIDDRAVDNDRMERDLQRKAELDAGRIEMWTKRLEQGEVKNLLTAELMQLRDKWMNSKDTNDKRRLKTAEDELIVRERIGDKRNASEQAIAGQRIASTERIANSKIAADRERTRIRLQMQAAVKEYETAVAEKRAAVATQNKILLMDLQKQLNELDDQ